MVFAWDDLALECGGVLSVAQVLAQQLPAERIDQSHMGGIPLHVNPASDQPGGAP